MSVCCDSVRNCADLARIEKIVKDHEKEVYKALLKQDKTIADLRCMFNGDIQKAITEYLLYMEKEGKLEEIITDTLLNDVLVLENKTAHILNVKEFGAVGNGVCDDTKAVMSAINHMQPGDTLQFPNGTFLVHGAIEIKKENITIKGDGVILCDYGFRVKASNFKAIGVRMEALSYSENCRAFMIDNSKRDAASPVIEGFVFKDCYFKNFFYSVCAIGGSYSYDGTEEAVGYPVRDLMIENCCSVTYTDKNAGHFQSIQVENIAYINNRTYGGQNASSYNAIKGNGFIRVIGNYDHNNSYASCEIENGSGNAIVANNTFNKKIWIDDSFDTVVNANTTKESIHITVGSNNGDANNVIISNNICKNIRCEQFGNYKGGIINNINISANNVMGTNTHGIWLHGNAVKNAKICNNIISGENTNDIAIQRSEQMRAFVHNNFGNGKTLLLTGSGGDVMIVDNYNFTVSGNRDPLSASHLERVFNGVQVTSENGDAWRVGVDNEGRVFTTKYN